MGGTFDPVHHAHLILAERAYEQCALDEIWMLPNGNPPHKRDTRQADMECRMEMLRLAIQNIPYLKLCDMERSASAYHYTYETLQRLNEQHPDTVFYFIMGADSLFEFDNWKEPGIISRECILLAAVRDHHARQQWRSGSGSWKSGMGQRSIYWTRPVWILPLRISGRACPKERKSPICCQRQWKCISGRRAYMARRTEQPKHRRDDSESENSICRRLKEKMQNRNKGRGQWMQSASRI